MKTYLVPTLLSAALVIGAVAATPAVAADTGFYVSGSIGSANIDVDTAKIAARGVSNISVDDEDTAWKLTAGYQFNRNWAVELGYNDFGTISATGTVGGLAATAEADVKAWTLAAVGTWPLSNNFSLFGKLGVYNANSDITATAGGSGILSSADSVPDGTDMFGGIGVRFDFTPTIGIIGEVEYFNGDATTTMYSIGMRFKF